MASTAAVKKAAEVEGLIATVLGTSNGSNSYDASMRAFDELRARIDLELARVPGSVSYAHLAREIIKCEFCDERTDRKGGVCEECAR